MCYASSCNPTCGDCRPKRLVEAHCLQCGALCYIGREEFLLLFDLPHRKNTLEEKLIARGGVETPRCGACGADLTETFRGAVAPEPCLLNQIVCGYPCGRRHEPYREGAGKCSQMVPVGKLDRPRKAG